MRAISNIIYAVIIVLVILALCFLLVPQLFGVKVKAVVSGSMEPDIPTGSIVYIVPTAFEDINIGDDITYKTQKGVYVTHRVISKDEEAGVLQTQGTANDIADVPIYGNSILGRVNFSVPYLGYVTQFISTTGGKIIMFISVLSLSLIALVLDKASKKEDTARTKV